MAENLGSGCPRHKFVMAQVPIRMRVLLSVFSMILIKALMPPSLIISSLYLISSAAMFPTPHMAWSTIPF